MRQKGYFFRGDMLLSWVFLVLCSVSVTWSSNILFLSLTVSRSHTIWDKTLAFALRSKHNITFVTHAENMTGDNVTIIILEGNKLLKSFLDNAFVAMILSGYLLACGELRNYILEPIITY